MSSRVQEVLAHKTGQKIVKSVKDSVNFYKLVADKWDLDTVKKCLAGTIETTIGMKAFEGVSSYLPRTISGRYLMMRNVMLCGQNQGGEKIGKTEEECLKVHILKGSSIEYMTKRFGERVSANPQVWFRYAAQNGHLEMVQYLVEKFELTADDARADDNFALRFAAENGQLETVKYLVDRFELTADDARFDDNYALREAAQNGQLETVQYLVEQFELTADDARADDNYALRSAAENGHLEMVQYLVDQFELTAADVTARDHEIQRTAIKKQNQPLLHFLRTRFNMTEADLYFASAAYE